MLLTSAQVSLAVSSGVVFFFTLALFLSGYVLQQRTLRELRASIKPGPRPSPVIFLPDRFKQSTTELPDGTIVAIDDGEEGIHDDAGRSQDVVIKVEPTLPDNGTGQQDPPPDEQQAIVREQSDSKADKPSADIEPTETVQNEVQSENGEQTAADKNDIEQVQEPLSRAERRRLIKEEIMRLSRGQERGYWQRRLW